MKLEIRHTKRTAGSAKCPLVTGSLDSMLPCSYLEKVDAPAEDDHVFAHSYCSSKELRPWTDDERRQIVAIPCTCLADFVTWRPPYAHCPDVRFVDKSVRNAERDPSAWHGFTKSSEGGASQGASTGGVKCPQPPEEVPINPKTGRPFLILYDDDV